MDFNRWFLLAEIHSDWRTGRIEARRQSYKKKGENKRRKKNEEQENQNKKNNGKVIPYSKLLS